MLHLLFYLLCILFKSLKHPSSHSPHATWRGRVRNSSCISAVITVAHFSSLLCSSVMHTLTLNLPWKMTSRRKCGACCSDLEAKDGSTSTSASSAIVQSRQVDRDGEKLFANRIICLVLLSLRLSSGPLPCLLSHLVLTSHFSVALTAPFKAHFLSQCGVAEVSLQPCYLRSLL